MAEFAPDRLPAHPLVVGLTAAMVLKAGPLAASRFAAEATDVKERLASDALIAAQAAEDAEQQLTAAAKKKSKAGRGGNPPDLAAAMTVAAEVQAAAKIARAGAEGDLKPPPNSCYDDLAELRDRRRFGVVAGYLGGCVKDSEPVMQVLYLDARLASWLLVRLPEIVLFDRVKDSTAAFGVRDVLWLKPDARVVRGDEDAVQRSYLNGPFVRVDDIAPTVSGGTYPRTGGLLLEATTPGCCTKTRP